MMTPPKSHVWPILFILALYGVFATVYAVVTPYRSPGYLVTMRQVVPDYGAPDERAHANYVARLLRGEGFGILRPNDPEGGENYQSHQPPLYYVLAAGWSRLVGADPQDAQLGQRVRYLNVVIGIATALGVYFAALWGTGNSAVAASAMAVGALMPMQLALCGAVSNDPLLIALCSWALAACAFGLRYGWTLARAAALGGLVGFALLTKTSALALAPAVVIALLWGQRRAESPGSAARHILVAAGIAAALVGPWWIRNAMVYGDPLAMNAFRASFTGTAQAADFILAFGAYDYWVRWVGWWTLRSFFGAFGYMDIFWPSPLYAFLAALGAVWALLGAMAWRRKQLPGATGFLIVASTFLCVVLAQFLYFNTIYFQGQARYLYPAIVPIACALGTGAWVMTGKRAWTWAILALGLLCLNVYSIKVVVEAFLTRAVNS